MNTSINAAKESFLKFELIPLLKHLKGDEKPKWGVMNAQQMVEHFADAVKNASGKLILPVLNEGEKLEKFREFLMSEIPFKENTKNALLPEEDLALRQESMNAAIGKLQSELNYFFESFQDNPSLQTNNAFFGSLDYAMNIQLLHKHAMHHLRQFGLA